MNPNLIIYILIGVIILIGYITFKKVAPSKKSKKMKQALRERRYAKAYHFFSKFFLTSYYVKSLYKKISNLSIYNRAEIQIRTVKLFYLGVSINVIVVTYSIFAFKDTIMVLISLFFSVMFSNVRINKRIDKDMDKVVKDFSVALSRIRQAYLNTHSIVEAIETSDIPTGVQKPFGEILHILTCTDPESAIRAFMTNVPYRTIQTFASVCYKINTEGDEIDKNGNSNFSQAISMLMSDVNSEIEKTTHRKNIFGIVEYLPIVPVILLVPIQKFFEYQIPGTALIYNSSYGYLIRIGTVLLSLLAYILVINISSSNTLRKDDRSKLLNVLLEFKVVKTFARDIAPKNKRRRKLERKLRESLSNMKVEELYLRKFSLGVVLFFLALVSTVITTELSKEYAKTSVKQMSIIASTKDAKYTDEMIQQMDIKYLSNPDKYTDDESIYTLVKTTMRDLSDMQITDEIARMKNKKESIENAYYKWYYALISVGVGLFGWFIPSYMLALRRKLVSSEEVEDFLQLQTLTSILMYTNIDTLDLLGELADNSTVHKDMFTYAYHSYSSNPELEISRLQSKVSNSDFKSFLGSLKLSISDLSLKEAFSDLITEREHLKKMQSMMIEKALRVRRSMCTPIVFIPLAILVIGVFLTPIVILGVSEMLKMLAQLKE